MRTDARPPDTSRRSPAFALLLGAWLVGAALACASDGEKAPSQLRFVDSQIFEKDLQKAMGEDMPSITVGFAGTDATMSDMPERLEKWLYVINERDDGRVDFRPDPAFVTPKAIPYGLAFSVGMAAWNIYKNWAHYAPSRDYNALVFYHPSDGYLTRVVFVRKPDAD